jgi:hypothetical protein
VIFDESDSLAGRCHIKECEQLVTELSQKNLSRGSNFCL